MQADRKKIERLLKTAKGQIDGILRMVEEDRYCMDISAQVMATDAILRKVNNERMRERGYSGRNRRREDRRADGGGRQAHKVVERSRKTESDIDKISYVL